MASFAINLKQLRKDRGLSQEDLAEKLGVKSGKQTISNWELEKTEPSLSDLRKIAELFRTSLAYLVEGVEPTVLQEPKPGYISVPMEEFIELQRRVIQQQDRRTDNPGQKEASN